MDTLPPGATIVNPATVTNPRDSRPSRMDEDRWGPGPIDLEDAGRNGEGGGPRLSTAGRVEARAGMLRLMGSDPAGRPARKLDGIALECHFPDAETHDGPRDAERGGL